MSRYHHRPANTRGWAVIRAARDRGTRGGAVRAAVDRDGSKSIIRSSYRKAARTTKRSKSCAGCVI